MKRKLGKYLILAETEDVYITRNGRVAAKLSNPNQDRVDLAKSLFGILPADYPGGGAGGALESDMRMLLDTCVVIDALQSREPFREVAQEVILTVANRKCHGFLTARSVADIYYLTHRITHHDQETRAVLNKLFRLFDLLDTTGMDCRRAPTSDLSDYEDAIMVESALRGGMDRIVTRSVRDYQGAPLPLYTPTDFLALTTPSAE